MTRDPLETSPLAERLAYFMGQLLGADEFRDEQTYHRGRLALVLRALVGQGTVAGLRVTASGGRVHVAPGVAIDCLGRVIEVRAPLCLDLAAWLSTGGGLADVILHAEATPTRPVFRVADASEDDPAQENAPSRLAEGGRIELVPAGGAAAEPPPAATRDAELEAVLGAWDVLPAVTGLLLARIAGPDPVTVDNRVRRFIRLAGRSC